MKLNEENLIPESHCDDVVVMMAAFVARGMGSVLAVSL